VETRLLAHSRATSLSLDRLRKQVVFERLIARLVVAAPNRWVLKGGFALDLRLGARARSTKTSPWLGETTWSMPQPTC
jgi:hypothetical protein